MDLAEAESAALFGRPKAHGSSLGVADVGKPRDPVTEWEDHVAAQFAALKRFASSRGCTLKKEHLPPFMTSATPGREVTVYYDAKGNRVWKATFPGQSGFGHFGFFTPAGYLRRLRLSNLIFDDDVTFEGIWNRQGGPSIITSQAYIQPHPHRFIPTEDEISAFLHGLGFVMNETTGLWERDDGIELADTHDRNFIRAPDENLYAIDVQPRLLPSYEWGKVRSLKS
ncbi:hypothetical protein WJU23_21780 [Prosthecobacter sp. SYSU 5D2]|uniref:putative polyvalent protein kinase domain-containing protein n=1 Tax=Prosthecobacter sp. SYSU 5D2 TaxID=3134134 RepID=UPI0031FF33DF